LNSSATVWAGLTLDRPRIMGVLNVTPDSFSDGGTFVAAKAALAAGMAMAEHGADIVDVGGESTRPGALTVLPDEEQRRVIPVIRALAAAGVRVSVDTRNAATMAAALDAGASIINDVSGLSHDAAALGLVARAGCPVVLMHMRGTPATMRARAVYADVPAEVVAELRACVAAAEASGVRRDAIVLDPGVGFAKDAAQSVAVLRALPALAVLGFPLLLGVSRKSFIGTIAGEANPLRRMPGSLAAGLFALSRGAAILRAHDVAETVQAVRVWQALNGG
jgi:dihydropteroate synthase